MSRCCLSSDRRVKGLRPAQIDFVWLTSSEAAGQVIGRLGQALVDMGVTLVARMDEVRWNRFDTKWTHGHKMKGFRELIYESEDCDITQWLTVIHIMRVKRWLLDCDATKGGRSDAVNVSCTACPCLPYDFCNKERVFPWTILIGSSLRWKWSVCFSRGRTQLLT